LVRLTLLLHDERFIKWKPTVLYAAMAIGLAVAVWVMKKNFLKLLLGSQLDCPTGSGCNLNIAWILYCFFMAAVNAYVAACISAPRPGSTSSSGVMCSRWCFWSARASTSRPT
jgi:intracellular septation protein